MVPASNRKVRALKIAAGTLAVVLAATVASCNPANSKKSASPLDHREDVQITGCTTEGGYAIAHVTATNGSSKASNYIIEIAFESPDGGTQYGTGNALINSLQPGQTGSDTANLLASAPDGFVCKIASADRLSAVG